MTESWKKITEYIPNSRYIEMFVSDLGRFKRVSRTGRVNFVNGSPRPDGYLGTRINGKERYTHRLVLKYFVSPCPAEMESDHINNIRNDNRLVNLQYLSKSDNCKKREYYMTQEVRDKISNTKKGCKKTEGSFKKGNIPWNKGLKLSK
jgi:hypothetical protein